MSEAADIEFDVRCAARLVAALYDIAEESFTSERKGPPVQVHARQTLCYLLRTVGDFDQVEIARALGRHRSTVGHAIGVVDTMRENAEVDRALDDLCDMYRRLREAHARIPALVEELAP